MINPMMKFILITILAFILLIQAQATCPGNPNPYKTINANFTKVESHAFGEKYVYFCEDMNQQFTILRLWGNSYQAGVAHGSLMKK
jgi:hypothetical protein